MYEDAALLPVHVLGAWVFTYMAVYDGDTYVYNYNAGPISLTEHEAYGRLVSEDALRQIQRLFLQEVALARLQPN